MPCRTERDGRDQFISDTHGALPRRHLFYLFAYFSPPPPPPPYLTPLRVSCPRPPSPFGPRAFNAFDHSLPPLSAVHDNRETRSKFCDESSVWVRLGPGLGYKYRTRNDETTKFRGSGYYLDKRSDGSPIGTTGPIGPISYPGNVAAGPLEKTLKTRNEQRASNRQRL